ncbi:hypothetical protein ACEQ8H_000560 [Pleosporales sp. CAS-2024a]
MSQPNNGQQWPHGVVAGGMIIDMLECLSRTIDPKDYALAIWLQKHYIEPFGRIERLDGLVVTERDRSILGYTYERFIDLQGERARAQKLWVPGLEPHLALPSPCYVQVPAMPANTEYKQWSANDMYFKNGIEVKRKAILERRCKDANHWDRTIWRAPSTVQVVRKNSLRLTPMLETIAEVSVKAGGTKYTLVPGPAAREKDKPQKTPPRRPIAQENAT